MLAVAVAWAASAVLACFVLAVSALGLIRHIRELQEELARAQRNLETLSGLAAELRLREVGGDEGTGIRGVGVSEPVA